MTHALPDLPYPYDALEPHIDAATMRIHHQEHHGGYVRKLNAALEAHEELQHHSLADLLAEPASVPEDVRATVRNNGGGHFNHSLFWKIMKPKGGGKPSGELADAIRGTFGAFDRFRQTFSETAAGLFGSGWTWLCVKNGKLGIETTPNQDTPMLQGCKPVLGLDVWEHAYYLKYQNRRTDYIAAWWNVVDWNQVAANLKRAR